MPSPARKPMLILFSPLTRRLFATKAYKHDAKTGRLRVTGEKHDVTAIACEQVPGLDRLLNGEKFASPEEVAKARKEGFDAAIAAVLSHTKGKTFVEAIAIRSACKEASR